MTPSMVFYYVDSPEQSATFYEDLFGRPPVEASPTFAMFVLDGGMKVAFWSRHTVEPGATAAGGGGELGFHVADPAAVQRAYDDLKGRGIELLQAPTEMDFGHSCMALDPDGHRLRIYSMAS